MQKCGCCRRSLDESQFIKCDKFWDGQQIIKTYYKLCNDCRIKARAANNKRREAKNAQAKEHYQKYKDDIQKQNKEYRKKNKDKLREYEQSFERRTFHKQWVKKKRAEDPSRFLFYAAKRRAKLKNIPFDISKEYVASLFPKDNKCPLLKIDLIVNSNKMEDNSPSLDRLYPNKGYIRDNIIIISYKANRIKNDATLEELKELTLSLDNVLNGSVL